MYVENYFLSLSGTYTTLDIEDTWAESVTVIQRYPTIHVCYMSKQEDIQDAFIFFVL